MFSDRVLSNASLAAVMKVVAITAGNLWQKGWAERNGGNISVNLSTFLGAWRPEVEEIKTLQLGVSMPILAGQIFYLTGKGCRMRDVGFSPLKRGCLLVVEPDGVSCKIIADELVEPTSEWPSHLAIHQFLMMHASKHTAVVHTHPTELVALTHCKQFLDEQYLNRVLWSMIPETRIFVPKGVGLVPYHLPGSHQLAEATIKALGRHEVVLWEKHGALAVGENSESCFDSVDVLNKSAQIYLTARGAGFEPQGLSDAQLDELSIHFGLGTEPG